MPHLALIRGRLKPFSCLISHNVRFLIIGSHAVNYHGVHRMINDLDIAVEPCKTNVHNLLAAIQDLDVRFRCDNIDELASPGMEFNLYPPHGYIHILNSIKGLTLQDAIAGAEIETIDGHEIPFISKADLIRSKEGLDDPKHKSDIEALRSIQ